MITDVLKMISAIHKKIVGFKQKKKLLRMIYPLFFNHFVPTKAIKPLRCKLLLRVEETQRERDVKEQYLSRRKNTTDVTFIFVKLIVWQENKTPERYYNRD